MSSRIPTIILIVLVCLVVLIGHSQPTFISNNILKDKIAGGWAGKMLGVTYGAPVEFRAQGVTFDDPINWKPTDVAGSIWQDDLYVQLTFMMTMDQFGIDAQAKTYQEMFARSGYMLWHANVQARKNFYDGIYPPESGSPEYNLHADDIDFQIEADYLGLMCPGMPNTASALASKIGHIMNYGDGVYGGVFIAALYSIAYFENDIQRVIDQALLSIPEESDYAATIRDVILLHKHYPADWKAAWKELYAKWGNENVCEAGSSFNIDAKVNGAFVVMGLLYGEGDPLKSMEISTRCGQDADCNPSSAMGVLGVIKGFNALPVQYQQAVKSMADSLFIHTDYSFNKAVDRTFQFAHELATRNGGKTTIASLGILLQQPEPVAMETAFPNIVFDHREYVFKGKGWDFKGALKEFGHENNPKQAMFSGQKGDEISFTFNGTGVSIMGNWLRSGGKADVYVDNVFKRTIDCYFFYAEQEHENMDIFHALDLPEGEHTVKLVVKGAKSAESEGMNVYVSGAIVYKTSKKVHEGYRFSFGK
jgi:hypothetical protein